MSSKREVLNGWSVTVWSLAVLFRSLCRNRKTIGSTLGFNVSGNGEAFGVSIDDWDLTERRGRNSAEGALIEAARFAWSTLDAADQRDLGNEPVVRPVPAEQQGGWVRVEERLPEPFTLVQFATPEAKGPTIGKWNGVRWMALFDLSRPGLVDYAKGQVAHWRQLPPPPVDSEPTTEKEES